MIENDMDADAFYADEMMKTEKPVYAGSKDYATNSIRCEDIRINNADGDTLVRLYLDDSKHAFAHLTVSVKDNSIVMRILNEEER
jgi:hypothetical protein